MNEREVHDLLEILEDRYDRSSTVITSQIPTKMWHDQLVQPTLADAICDRLVHNAHVRGAEAEVSPMAARRAAMIVEARVRREQLQWRVVLGIVMAGLMYLGFVVGLVVRTG